MSELAFLLGIKRIFFIGIGGISMSGLACFLSEKGYEISGSDRVKNEILQKLETEGIKVFYEHNPENLNNVQAVVYSSAISEDNPELVFAKKQGLKIIKRSELLGEILSRYKRSVGISGCHGKTTTTAMLSNILIQANLDPTVFLGGECIEFGNYRKGSSQIAVCEACEYKKSFLDFSPKISVVLNVDNDHMDSYNGMNDLVLSFKKFVGDNLAIINADDNYADYIANCTTIKFGIEKPSSYYATGLKYNGKGYSFTACAYSKPYGRINLKVSGRHNVYNALCAFAVADVLGVSFQVVKRALENFNGVKRRNEYLGEKFGAKWVADYAHHPTEIKASIRAFLESGEDFITIFQPHTYSRTEKLMLDFVEVLKHVKNLILYKTYPARENYNIKGDAKTLYQRLLDEGMHNCAYADTDVQLIELVKNSSKTNKRVLVLGAGDIYDIAKRIICEKES